MSEPKADIRSIGPSPADHPAARAWRKLGSIHALPDKIDVLKDDKPEWGVYRLLGAGPQGASVIAKRCDSEAAGIEYSIYRDVLPHLAISALQCYGLVADNNARYSWLFLEDAGDGEYSSGVEDHRILAGRWLGAMNSSARQLPLASRLPDLGPASYLEVLRLARGMTQENSLHPAFDNDDRRMLSAIASHCEFLETQWGRVEQFCAAMPRTLVHGDLSPWNARIRVDRTGPSLLVMDWESAGWGVPAADLTQFAGNALSPDIAAYWSVAQGCWPGLDFSDARLLAGLGTVFRWINAVAWANWGFRDSAIDWFTTEMKCYEPEIDEWAKGTKSILELW
jgi:hypothetical protein